MLLVADQRSPEWHAARKGKITASIAAACLGLHPYCSRQKAWRIITGREEVKVNADIQAGVDLEPVARELYEIETGNLVVETGFWVDGFYPWLGASPDGLVDDWGCIEIKCPRQIKDEIPEHYLIQMNLQMSIAVRAWCDFVQYCPPHINVKRVEMDADMNLKIVAGLREFYEQYILTDTQPPRKRSA